MQSIRHASGDPQAAAVIHAEGGEVEQRSPAGSRVQRMRDSPVRDNRGYDQQAGSDVVPGIVIICERE
ncbi:hypothetical protein D3C81_1711340 [compost metagenome]